MPKKETPKDENEVLPIVTSGGAGVSIGRWYDERRLDLR